MTSAQILDLMMLLSALESWTMANPQSRLPAPLHKRLDAAVSALRAGFDDARTREAVAAAMIQGDVIAQEARARHADRASAQAFADGAIYAQMVALEALQKGGAA